MLYIQCCTYNVVQTTAGRPTVFQRLQGHMLRYVKETLCKSDFNEIKLNANLMQLGNFVDLFLARYVSDTYAHH